MEFLVYVICFFIFSVLLPRKFSSNLLIKLRLSCFSFYFRDFPWISLIFTNLLMFILPFHVILMLMLIYISIHTPQIPTWIYQTQLILFNFLISIMRHIMACILDWNCVCVSHENENILNLWCKHHSPNGIDFQMIHIFRWNLLFWN